MNESIRRNVADAFVVVSARKNGNRTKRRPIRKKVTTKRKHIRLRDKKSVIFIRNRTK